MALAVLLAFLLIEITVPRLTEIAAGYWLAWLEQFERIEVERKYKKCVQLQDQIYSLDDRLHDLAHNLGDIGREKLGRERRVLARKYNRLYIQLRQHYPAKLDMITPTKLGNTLRVSDQRILERYDLDAVVIYPRLLALLPRKKRRKAEIAHAALDMWIRLAVTFPILAFVILISTAPVGGPITTPYSVTAVIIVSLALASVGCYQESIRSAQKLGTQIEVIFDLHRADLLRAMNLPVPSDLETERHLFSTLSTILSGNSLDDNLTVHYESGGNATKKARQGMTHIVTQYNVQQAMAVGERSSARSRNVRFVQRVPKSRNTASAYRKKSNQ